MLPRTCCQCHDLMLRFPSNIANPDEFAQFPGTTGLAEFLQQLVFGRQIEPVFGRQHLVGEVFQRIRDQVIAFATAQDADPACGPASRRAGPPLRRKRGPAENGSGELAERNGTRTREIVAPIPVRRKSEAIAQILERAISETASRKSLAPGTPGRRGAWSPGYPAKTHAPFEALNRLTIVSTMPHRIPRVLRPLAHTRQSAGQCPNRPPS